MNSGTELWLFAVSLGASALGGMLGMASGGALPWDDSFIQNNRYNSLPNVWHTRSAERRRIPRVFMLR